jgi:hypothetical protein
MENLTRFLPLNSLLHTVKVVKWGGSNPMEFLKFFFKVFSFEANGLQETLADSAGECQACS